MSKILPTHLYNWVYGFMKKHDLFPKSGHAVVAFSGGEDSVLLYHILNQLLAQKIPELKSIHAIHIDHGLREDSSLQAAQLLDAYPSIEVQKIAEQAPSSDIELWARRKRYQLLKRELHLGDGLYMGHHIDDSIEWYMRQLFSSSTPAPMGIPVRNGALMRPLHCLTKSQISRFVSKLGLFFVYDSSNEDCRFQRNLMRHHILKEIYSLYPKGQAHFVEQANLWARSYKKKSLPRTQIIRHQDLHIFMAPQQGMRWEDCRGQLQNSLHELSSNNRGEIRSNLNKLLAVLDSPRGARGPLHFSGGVLAFLYGPQMLILTNKAGLVFWKRWDEEQSLLLYGGTQIPVIHTARRGVLSTQQHFLPFIFFKKEELSFMGKKASKGLGPDPIFTHTTQAMIDLGYAYRPGPFFSKALGKTQKRDWSIALVCMR